VLELGGKVVSYEQLICSNEDSQAALDERNTMIELLLREKGKIEVILEGALKKAEAFEKQNAELNKVLAIAFRTIKVKNEETEVLNEYLKDMKSKTHTYNPVKKDSVDVKVAKELNNMPDSKHTNKQFSRVGGGVYAFGNKKHIIKVENDKVLGKFVCGCVVRVGGGFIGLEEFLQAHTPTESRPSKQS